MELNEIMDELNLRVRSVRKKYTLAMVLLTSAYYVFILYIGMNVHSAKKSTFSGDQVE